MTTRTGRIWITLLCLWLTLSVPGQAQSPGESPAPGGGDRSLAPTAAMPSWVVPVLRLVSATHVQPTTGIVLSSGLVLVPDDFAAIGDEIVVLDGGTDIVRNGRPARLERKFPAAGLKILSVEGLGRSGAVLAAGGVADGGRIFLTAFPPAEQISEGEPPLHAPATAVVFGETGQPTVSSQSPLPNVTGALVDECGNLVGVSLAHDVQSMEVSSSTRYRWRETLLRIFSQMQLSPLEAECGAHPDVNRVEPEPVVAAAPKSEETTVAPQPVIEETLDPEPEPEADEETEPPAGDLPEPPVEILPPIEKEPLTLPEAEEETGWLWLGTALVLIGLGLALHRLRRTDGEPPPNLEATTAAQRPEDPAALEEETTWQSENLDSILWIHGELTDGTTFEDSCPVSQHAVNVVIGRGEVNLRIDSAAVSRQHAAVNGSSSELTVTDLGSSNGTSIKGVPCLEGEIMYFESGDPLVFGDALCTLEITPRSERRNPDS